MENAGGNQGRTLKKKKERKKKITFNAHRSHSGGPIRAVTRCTTHDKWGSFGHVGGAAAQQRTDHHRVFLRLFRLGLAATLVRGRTL